MDYQKIDELILDGSIEVSGMTDDGNFTFKFTDKLKENNPEIYEEVIKFFYSQVMFFWEKGFINIDIQEENPLVGLTDKVFDQDALQELSPIQRLNLNLIMQSMLDADQ